jgi:hypothetical protein
MNGLNDDVRANPADRVIREWLDAAMPPTPDRVVDGVLAAVPSTGQQTGFLPPIVLSPLRAVGLMAAAVAVTFVVFSTIGRFPFVGPGTTPSPSPSPTAAPTASPTAGPSALPAGYRAAIDMGADTWNIVVDERSIWVQIGDTGINRIDRGTNRDTGLRLPEVPNAVIAGGQLWALDVGTGIVRLDPITGAVLQTVPGISGYYIAVDGTTAWVSDVGHSVDKVDLVSGKVLTTIDVPVGPKELAVGFGSVWVMCDNGKTIARIDMATDAVSALIPEPGGPANVAIGDDAVWVWSHGQQLIRVDPLTDTIVAAIDGISPGPGAGVAYGGGYAWVAVVDGVAKVDPATNTIVDVIPVPQPGSWIDIVYFDGELFVSTIDGHVIFEIDPTP